MTAAVVAVHADAEHRMAKVPQQGITLLAGLGVAGDAHAGVTVQHRSRVRRAGVMAVVVTGGEIRPGDPVHVTLPAPPLRPLEPV